MQSTLAKLCLCRTAALGDRWYRCKDCQQDCVIYNSCGDRNCPQCAGAKRADWLASTSQLLREGVPYFQVVFTIPDSLSSLSLGNRREMYNLLFRSAWRTLKEVIEDEQGYQAAALMVLHTWNQKLEAHNHVHAVVPGAGPSLEDAERWVTSGRKRKRWGKRDRRAYLVDAGRLRTCFRDRFLKGLKRLHKDGKLKLEGDFEELQDPSAWDEMLEALREVNWTVFIEPPPKETSRPEHVVKYLARYLTGGPISNRRLISHEDGMVSFWARRGDTPGGGGQASSEPYEISGTEFVRRWSLHVLPRGYVKTRRFGGYSASYQAEYLKQCDELLSQQSAGEKPTTDPAADQPADPPQEPERKCVCPGCGQAMELQRVIDRPGWSKAMGSNARPKWYRDD